MNTGLAQRLRDTTAPLHRQAERTRFMAALLAGRADRRAYLHLLRNLMPVYAALEPLLDTHCEHAWLRGLWTPSLARLPALQRDIDEFERDQTVETMALPASLAYAQRLSRLFATSPTSAEDRSATDHDGAVARLLAHAYVRCLGDLSGGQVLKRVVTQRLGVTGSAGTDFYDFGAPNEVAAVLQRWRQGLAALPAEGVLADAAVAEACWSFEQHIRLFDELESLLHPLSQPN